MKARRHTHRPYIPFNLHTYNPPHTGCTAARTRRGSPPSRSLRRTTPTLSRGTIETMIIMHVVFVQCRLIQASKPIGPRPDEPNYPTNSAHINSSSPPRQLHPRDPPDRGGRPEKRPQNQSNSSTITIIPRPRQHRHRRRGIDAARPQQKATGVGSRARGGGINQGSRGRGHRGRRGVAAAAIVGDF